MSATMNILDFGAFPDGKSPCTEAIQGAINACHEVGGGQVFCGPGAFLTGALELKSRVELHLAPGCRLVGSPHLEDYAPLDAPGFKGETAPEKSSHSLIRAVEAEDIAITGAGTIDGSGLAFYEDPTGEGKLAKPPTPRPRLVMFYRCRGVRICDAAFVDSPCWTIWLMQCDGAGVRGISIAGNRRMRNVDGIDVDACRNVTISDCRIDTEDDCLVLRSIQSLYETPAVCENVAVTNCVLKTSCQGVRVGCPSDGTIRNCTFSNLLIESSGNGILFEYPHRYRVSERERSADVSNIQFSNVVANTRRFPVKIAVEEGIALKRVSDLRFSDFRIQSGAPCLVQGSPETTVRNVEFSNVRIETTGEDAIVCRRCSGIRLDGVEVSNLPAED